MSIDCSKPTGMILLSWPATRLGVDMQPSSVQKDIKEILLGRTSLFLIKERAVKKSTPHPHPALCLGDLMSGAVL